MFKGIVVSFSVFCFFLRISLGLIYGKDNIYFRVCERYCVLVSFFVFKVICIFKFLKVLFEFGFSVLSLGMWVRVF